MTRRRTPLQDFSEKNRKDRNYAYVLLVVVTALMAFVLYSNSPYRGDPKHKGP